MDESTTVTNLGSIQLGPERSTAGLPSLPPLIIRYRYRSTPSAREGGQREVGDLFRLDGSTTVDRLLPVSSTVLGGLQPVTQANGDGSGSLDSVRGEERSTCATCEGWDRGERTDGDQHGTEGGHDLWMFGGQKVQSVGGVYEPGRHVRNGSDS